MSSPSIEQTRALAGWAHRAQTDKAGHPYIQHVERVANRVREKLAGLDGIAIPQDEADDIVRAAYLHDIIEDTPFDAAALAGLGYGPRVVAMVEAVTRRPGDGLTYMDKIRLIAASGDIGAILIKLSDNEDNSDPVRIAALPPEQQGVAQRYERSMRILRAALAAWIAKHAEGR